VIRRFFRCAGICNDVLYPVLPNKSTCNEKDFSVCNTTKLRQATTITVIIIIITDRF